MAEIVPMLLVYFQIQLKCTLGNLVTWPWLQRNMVGFLVVFITDLDSCQKKTNKTGGGAELCKQVHVFPEEICHNF